MKFKLNLNERLLFLNLLPKENNFATIRIIRTVNKEVGITDAEYKDFGIKQNNGQISWASNEDPLKRKKELKAVAREKDFEIGQIATELVKSELKKLDENKKLTNNHISLYEKFIKE